MSARRVAMVTGGARAVGKAVTLRLARDFDTVVVNHFRSPEAAQETAEELQRLGVEALVVRGSVARPEQRDRMFAEVADAVGHLDLLVNCAADGGLVPFDEVTEELLDKAFATDLKGSLGCARAAAELMQGRRGAIVNVSTLGGGQLVMANYFACAPAKAAVEALTRYLAVEFAPRGIRVNTAVAGMLRSPVADQFPQAEQMQRAVADATPMGRLGNPEELAEVVAFLGSEAASWVTGQTVVADGGLSTGAVMLSPPRQESRPAPTPKLPVVAAAEIPAAAPAPLTAALEPLAAASGIPAATAAQASASPRPSSPSEDEIVVVATGLVVPGANDPEEFWRDLINGADRMIPIPAERWDNELFWTADGKAEDKTYSRHSGFITDFRPDPGLLAELEAGLDGNTELTTLWLRHCLHQVLGQTTLRADDACSLVIGYTADGSQHLEEATIRAAMEARMPRALQAAGVPEAERQRWLGRVEEVLARRYHRGVGTPHHYLPHQVGTRAMEGLLPRGTELLVVDTACSSSLYSVDLAIKGLREGRHDVAVAGGAFAVGPRGSVLFAKLNGLSRRGQVRSLDRDADGVLFSDGAGLVVLKTLSRARADGDRVLATVSGFGSSSDGKGKAIYAPSAAGQRIAIDRAYAADVPAPDWVIAHATGTPAGDLAEFTTLRTTLGRTALGTSADDAGATPARAVALTSNKSVIGHTGWAAGVASIVHAVKGLEHEQIPPQHQFGGLAASFEADGCGLTVPAEPVPWPAHDGTARGRRTVAISGFGFGGTNAHLVLSDAPADHDVPALLPPLGDRERLAVVGLTTHLPGAPADGERPALDGVASSFGETYPAPSLAKVKMPPAMVRAIDRAQLMILECAHAMRERLGDFWTDHQDRTGVVLGHLGATRNAMLYASRCYVDDLDQALRADPELVAQPWLGAALESLREDVRATCPPSTEDTFPGMMPNVIPARVANYFDLHGLNLTVDTGFTSSLAAVDVAARYLHTGEIDLALVGGINGNDTAEVRSMLRDVLGDAEIAEGAFLLAVTTESRAAAAGIPVLALLEPGARCHARGRRRGEPG